MDQAVAFNTGVLMTYDSDLLHVEPAVLGAPLHLVLVDLRAAKDTVVILEGLQVGVRMGVQVGVWGRGAHWGPRGSQRWGCGRVGRNGALGTKC